MEYYKNLSLEDLFYINDEGLVCCEEWKDVVDYVGFYKTSDLGRIKSLNYRRSNKDGILTQILDNKGYLIVNLYNNGIQKTAKVHQLVTESFFGHKPCGYELVINHKNFIRTDNRLKNLEIITTRENTNKKHLQSSSNYTGVYWDKSKNKWRAIIHFNKKKKSLGCFDNELEANEFYQNALKAIETKGEIIIKYPNFSSKYRGVYFSNKIKKWVSTIEINGKKRQLGLFINELDAHNAREKEKASLL